MIAILPSELEPFVQTEIASGRFASADDVIVAAVKLLRDLSNQPQSTLEELDELRQKIAEGHDDIVNGRVRRINNEAESRAYAEEIKARGRARLQAERVTP